MDPRQKVHPKTGGELQQSLQATFYLVCVGVGRINTRNGQLQKTLSGLFRAVGGPHLKEDFDQYRVFVETEGNIRHSIEFEGECPIPGHISFLNIKPRTLDQVHATKQAHATAAFRNPGHQSTHPPVWLTERTLVIVLGSRKFLGKVIDLFLERTGTLRRVTFDYMIEICGLVEACGTDVTNTYLYVNTRDEKDFYPGNIDALVEAANTMTTEELEELLAAGK